LAHGYEMMMTPLQVLNVYNAVANGGKMMKPYIVEEIYEDGECTNRIEPHVINKSIAGPSAIMKARQLLEGAVESGTARKLKVENVSFAGKTGTTRLNYWKETKKEYNASFAGYFPAEYPKYSAIVVIYNPQGAYYGSQVAGPVFSTIVRRLSGMETRSGIQQSKERQIVKAHSGYKSDYQKVLDYVGLGYKDKGRGRWIDLESEAQTVSIEDKKILKKSIPNVKGMGLRDAVYVLESLGLDVEYHGMGKVYKQSIPTGRTIDGQTINIYLN